MKLLKAHFRPRFYRYFQAWYRRNQHRFALPLTLARQRRWGIYLGIAGIPDKKMHFYLTYKNRNFQDGSLCFYYGNEMIDNMVWMETYPERRPEGFICHECQRYFNGLRTSTSAYELADLEKAAQGYPSTEAYIESKLRAFPSVEALWEDHIFEVILKTVNETIARAARVEFCVGPSVSYVRYINRDQPAESEESELTRVVDVIHVP